MKITSGFLVPYPSTQREKSVLGMCRDNGLINLKSNLRNMKRMSLYCFLKLHFRAQSVRIQKLKLSDENVCRICQFHLFVVDIYPSRLQPIILCTTFIQITNDSTQYYIKHEALTSFLCSRLYLLLRLLDLLR